ncbi:MAG: PAS domain S-box protein [Magnetococcales bacterium]|nr:PAS domain S-box protein [Magnetococcales bacterium]
MSADSTLHEIAKEAFPYRWVVRSVVSFIVVLALFCLILAALSWRISIRYAPLVEANTELKQELTLFHLWFEEILLNDPSLAREVIWIHLENAKSHARTMLDGGVIRERTVLSLKKPRLRQSIRHLLSRVEVLEARARDRFDSGFENWAGSDAGQAFDGIFNAVLKDVDQLGSVLQGDLNQHLGQVRYLSLGMGGLILLFGGLALLLFHRYQKRLTREMARLNAIMMSTGEGVFGLDLEGRCIFVNPVCLKMMGYSNPKELLGREIHAVIHTPGRESQRASSGLNQSGKDANCPLCASFLKGEVVHVADDLFQRADGTLFSAEYRSHPILQEGEISGAVVTFADISKRKQAEAEMRLQDAALKAAANTVVITDPEGQIQWVNPAFTVNSGFSPEEALGQNPKVLKSGKHDADFYARLWNTIKGGEVWQGVFANRHKDGHLYHEDATITPVRNEEGQISAFIAVKQNISERVADQAARHKSEALLRATIDSTKDGILVVDDQGQVMTTNPRFKEMWQIPDTLFETRDDKQLLAYVLGQLQEPEVFLNKVQQLYRSRESDSGILHFKDGRVFERYSQPLIVEDHLSGRIWSFSDITSRTRAEKGIRQAHERLQHSESQMRDILNNAPMVVFLKDLDGRFLFVNPRHEKLFGVSSARLQGKSDFDVFPKEVAEKFRKNDQAVLAADQPMEMEERVSMGDGEQVYVSLKFPLKDSAGTPYGVCGMAIDITERKKAQQDLAEKTAFIDNILHSSPDLAIAATDMDFRIRYYNPVAEKIFGYTAHEAIGQTVQEIHTREKVDHARFDRAVEIVRQEGHYRYSVTDEKAGRQRVVESQVTGIKDRSGNLTGFVLMSRDVTQQRKLQEDLIRSKEEAETANRAKTLFLAHMSHEIRTPLNAILGMGDLLEETETTQEQRQFLETSRRASGTLLALVNDILDLSKIEAQQLDLVLTEFELERLVQGTLDIQKGPARDKEIDLVLEMDPKTPQAVRGDRDRLRQVFLNLLNNAIKFTSIGQVIFRVEAGEADWIHFSVRDSGIGIPPDRLESIFNPFVQADASTTRQFGGTGLGLTICQRLLQAMGGDIRVESTVGVGSTFFVSVPLPKVDLRVEESPEVSEVKGRGGNPSLTVKEGLKILLVDDSEDNLFLIQAFLKKTPHKIVTAMDGLQALKKFKSHDFDLVLMDMLMPVLDGYEATRRIRGWEKQEGRLPVTIMALTAQALKEDLDRTLTSGCDGHLTKPIKKLRLIQELERIAEEIERSS